MYVYTHIHTHIYTHTHTHTHIHTHLYTNMHDYTIIIINEHSEREREKEREEGREGGRAEGREGFSASQEHEVLMVFLYRPHEDKGETKPTTLNPRP